MGASFLATTRILSRERARSHRLLAGVALDDSAFQFDCE
jgi:hypothetical protein